MVKHQKIIGRTDTSSENPWQVGCSCGWSSLASDEKAGTKLHTKHRTESRASYRLSRPYRGGVFYVLNVPPINGDWAYTSDPEQAAVVNETTKNRYLRHLRACGIKGMTTLVI